MAKHFLQELFRQIMKKKIKTSKRSSHSPYGWKINILLATNYQQEHNNCLDMRPNTYNYS